MTDKKRARDMSETVFSLRTLIAAVLAFAIAPILTSSAEEIRPGVLRTPESAFENLPGYNFVANYVDVQGYRVHYVDEGPSDGPVILLLHGEPSWSYLYRKMIPPLRNAGYRVIAPDLIGFGKSDKPVDPWDHSYQMHVDAMSELVTALDLNDITFFGQDWGGLIGLRVAAKEPQRFARAVAANTDLPDANPYLAPFQYALFNLMVWWVGPLTQEELQAELSFPRWVSFAWNADPFPVSGIIQGMTTSELSAGVIAAYDAPFPDETYKAGPRVMPSLVPSQLGANRAAWTDVFEKWEKPFMTAFSDSDPITRGREAGFQTRIPGAQGQPHVTIKKGGHFLQEDKGEELAAVIMEFIERTR
jgi:haloalkane dehalogenase